MSHRFSQIATIVMALVAALAVGGVGYVYLNRTPPPEEGRRPVGPRTLADTPASQPAVADPFSLFGAVGREFEEVDRDPAGLPAPPIARRRSTLRFKTPAGVQEVGRYLANTQPDMLESFYADRLPGLGWTAVGPSKFGGLMFRRPGGECTVRASRAAASQPAELKVVLILNR